MRLCITIMGFLAIFATSIENTSYATHSYSKPPPEINIHDHALALIKRYEGLRLSAYWDHNGCSIGWGTRARSCDETITKKEADLRIDRIVTHLVKDVEKHFPDLHDEGKVALVSFAYNCHRGWRDVKQNGLERHSVWCKKASGVVLRGLVKRRAEESRMIFPQKSKEKLANVQESL